MNHKNLDAWKKSIELVTKLYELTKLFPESEKFGLINQIRRSAVSIPSNIAEGAGRDSPKEYLRFLSIAMGSLSELETQIIIAQNLEYLKENRILNELNDVKMLILGLRRYLKKHI